MAKTDNILGIAYLGMGAPGDGIMGATLTEFNAVEVGSATLDGASATQNNLPTEQDDAYLSLNDSVTPTSLTFRLYGVTPDQAELIAGGTATATGWQAPRTVPNIYLSVQLKGQPIQGKVAVLNFPYAKVSARQQGTITKNALPAWEVTVTANTPISAAEVEGAPYEWDVENE